MARIRPRGLDPVLRAAHAGAGYDQIESPEDHRRGHGLALPRRAQARTEDVSMPRTCVVAIAGILALTGLMRPAPGPAHEQKLPIIGPAPDFALISQDGLPAGLGDFRGRVLAVTFIFTSCADTCPLLTAKMAKVQDELGADFASRIAFVS